MIALKGLVGPVRLSGEAGGGLAGTQKYKYVFYTRAPPRDTVLVVGRHFNFAPQSRFSIYNERHTLQSAKQ